MYSALCPYMMGQTMMYTVDTAHTMDTHLAVDVANIINATCEVITSFVWRNIC